jgi:hypothetical protein
MRAAVVFGFSGSLLCAAAGFWPADGELCRYTGVGAGPSAHGTRPCPPSHISTGRRPGGANGHDSDVVAVETRGRMAGLLLPAAYGCARFLPAFLFLLRSLSGDCYQC